MVIYGTLWNIYPETMVAESDAANISKIGLLVLEIPNFHL